VDKGWGEKSCHVRCLWQRFCCGRQGQALCMTYVFLSMTLSMHDDIWWRYNYCLDDGGLQFYARIVAIQFCCVLYVSVLPLSF
jgi:hypothetical protein